MPGTGQPHRSNTSVARLHDEEIRCSVSPRPILLRQAHDLSLNERDATLLWLRLPRLLLTLICVLICERDEREMQMSTTTFGTREVLDVIEKGNIYRDRMSVAIVSGQTGKHPRLNFPIS